MQSHCQLLSFGDRASVLADVVGIPQGKFCGILRLCQKKPKGERDVGLYWNVGRR